MEKEIGKIPKGEYQGTATEIVVGIREYNGKTGIDIREYTQSETYTGPTKKGLRIPADKFEDFKKMINSINPTDLSTPTTHNSQLTTTKSKTFSEPNATEDDDAGINEEGLM